MNQNQNETEALQDQQAFVCQGCGLKVDLPLKKLIAIGYGHVECPHCKAVNPLAWQKSLRDDRLEAVRG